MTVSFFDTTEVEQALFVSLLPRGHTLLFHTGSLTKAHARAIKDTDILYVRSFSHVTTDILRLLPGVKFIATRSTGFDHIDIGFCKHQGIIVSNVPSYASNAVAEHTFGLLLALAHNIVVCADYTRNGSFAVGQEGFEISGKTMGIVGLGNIGARVAQIAKGFGMHVIVTTKHPSSERAKEHGVIFVDLTTLLVKSDVVSFHVPLNQKTYHVLNMGNISIIKKGGILLNTSRGEVVEARAIFWALTKGLLAGAGLDVLEDEQSLKKRNDQSPLAIVNRRLMADERVLVTPHNAYHTKEAIDTILRLSAENIKAFIKNKPINRVC